MEHKELETGRVNSYWFSGMNGILGFFFRRDPFGDIQRASFPKQSSGSTGPGISMMIFALFSSLKKVHLPPVVITVKLSQLIYYIFALFLFTQHNNFYLPNIFYFVVTFVPSESLM
jgi:hypothetical protein